ncbi:hypothetical protein GGS20DRAFT_420815 [Poronia punctata]|nr:hypothetical protein GGS20DRAFT_420815 [Poronia punctata]
MASHFAVSTPSPPGSIRTPGTPKHGYSDNWEPFSPRKSARISSQQLANRTPSPRSSNQSAQSSTKLSSKSATTFSTPGTSPHKKRAPVMDSVRRASTAATAKRAFDAGDALGTTPNPKPQEKPQSAISSSQRLEMLPTPAKTPRKQPDAKAEAASRAVARNLFGSGANILATPHKKAKRYTGLSLDSFRAEEVAEDIEIFTDTRDHVPQVDNSTDNPFFGPSAPAEPPLRRSKRKQVVIPGEGKQAVEDAVKRSDGVLVVFRGKKIFRKFSEINDTDFDGEADGEDGIGAENGGQTRRQRPMTRSSIKPRLLFPRETKGKQVASITAELEDEEAPTDIEDHVTGGTDEQVLEPETPAYAAEDEAKTPAAPRFAPASPPSTARATRSMDKLRDAETPMKQPKVRSPFDGWRRSKSRAVTQGQKRGGEALAQSPASTKRPRA